MRYHLVVSDIDGTLTDNNRCIPKRTKKAVEQFRERGGIFTFATGRIEESARRYYEELNLQTPAILYNGAKIVNLYDNQCFFEDRLHAHHVNEALNLIKDYPCDTLIYYQGKAYVSKINDVIKEYMLKDSIECIELDDLSNFRNDTPTKILIIGERIHYESFQKQFIQRCNPKPNIVNSEKTYLEILPLGVTKGIALEKLCDILEISIDKAAAIGDNLNDMEMVLKAGLGVAVDNAHADLKKAANYITKSNNEEGVAEVLERILNDEWF